MRRAIVTALALFWASVTAPVCAQAASSAQQVTSASDLADYLNPTGRVDASSGGERFVPITTPDGPHNVWIKRIVRLRPIPLQGRK